MDLHNCTVRLHGETHMTVAKRDVTAADIVLLRQTHGTDAVVDIVVTRQGKRPDRKEIERLRAFYGDVAVDRAWPGAIMRLPRTLEEAGISLQPVSEEEDDEEGADEVSPEVEAHLKAGGLDVSALA